MSVLKPAFDEPVVALSSLPAYWRWMERIRNGDVPGAVKVGGNWFLPLRLVEQEAADE